MIQNLPFEILYKVSDYYLDLVSFGIFKKKINFVHNELINSEPVLNITEDLFDWFLDFEYAIRLPKLVQIPD